MADQGSVQLPKPLLGTMAVLSAAPVLRAGDVQVLELVQALWLGVVAAAFLCAGLKLNADSPWRPYGRRYVLFFAGCAVVSVLALRLPFFTPPDVSFLKLPVVLSVARISELFLAAYFMLAIAATLRGRPALLRLVLDAYSWTGVASACVSILSWAVLQVAGVAIPSVYGPDQRVRGFFNEGGPYGIFLVSVAVVILVRNRLLPPRYTFLPKAALLVLFAALLLSGSKAGFLALAGISVAGAMACGTLRQKMGVAALSVGMASLMVAAFPDKLYGYFYSYLNLDEALYYRPGDPNLVMGRIAAAVIVPRMIAAHPVTGIGVGNYSLMRNDPDYLQGLPPVVDWDLSGLGLFGAAAEFGIPLTLFFLAVLLRPLLRMRKRRVSGVVAAAAAFQPVAFLMGVNLNFFYPWLVAGLVLSLESAEG